MLKMFPEARISTASQRTGFKPLKPYSNPTQPEEQPSAQHMKTRPTQANCLPAGWVGKPAETA